MDRVSIIIPGKPKSGQTKKQRIVRRKDGTQFISHYPDKEIEEHVDTVRSLATKAMDGMQPFTGAVRMRYRIYIPIPKSMPKYKVQQIHQGLLFCCRTPDLDNAMKSCIDGVKKAVMADDKQVVRLSDDSGRYYGRWERIEIDVEPLTHCPYQAAEFADIAEPTVAGDLFAEDAA